MLFSKMQPKVAPLLTQRYIMNQPSTKRVLLVEGDQFTRFMMQEIIKVLGANVDIAVSGEDGCSLIDQNPNRYGLVLMDVHMSKMSGVDATKVIRSRQKYPTRYIPIIAVTADKKYHAKSILSKLGMDGFISKPVTSVELNGLIARYCPTAIKHN